MDPVIRQYRGWDIYFDSEDNFYCLQVGFQNSPAKNKSIAVVKRYIDEFIAHNSSFEPFWVERKGNEWVPENKIKIIGLRKDNKFLYEGSNGRKQQVSGDYEQNYILIDEKNKPIWDEADLIKKEISKLEEKRIKVLDKISGTTLAEFKKNLLEHGE